MATTRPTTKTPAKTKTKTRTAPRKRVKAQLDLELQRRPDSGPTTLVRREQGTMAKTKRAATSKKTRSTGPTTLVVREQVSIDTRRGAAPARRPIYATVARAAPASKRRSGGAAKGRHAGATVRKGVAIAGIAIGYMDRPGSAMEATIAKIPALGGSRKITMALGLHLLARKRPGGYIDHAATAMTAVAAYDIGRNGFAGLGLQGPGDGGTVARF